MCPHCDAAFNVADDLRGKKVRCRECEKPVPVVAAKPRKADPDDDEREERLQSKKPQKPVPASARRRDDDDEARPVRRKAQRYDDDGDEDKRPAAGKGKKKSAMPLIVGGIVGGVVVVGGVVGLIIWLANREDKTAEVTPVKAPANFPAGPNGPPAGMMMGQKGGMQGGMKGDGGGLRGANKEVDDIIKGVDPKEALVAGGPGHVNELREAAKSVEKLPDAVVKKIQDSTVYFRTREKKDSVAGSSGSGFLAFEKGIVLTNAHVVHMIEPGTDEPEDITVIVRKGETDAKELKGRVLAVDRTVDLAVVKVDPAGLPPALEVKSTTGLQPTQQVWVCGFPLGEVVSKNVTILEGKVASISKDDKSGLPKRVILTSDMQPGCSGGPCVNPLGEVIGVNVAGLRGTRINMAVPGEYVHTIVNGRITRARTGPAYRSLGHVHVPVTMDIINPLDRIQKIEVEMWTGNNDPKYTPPSSNGKPPGPREGDSQRVTFALDLPKAGSDNSELATGHFVLPDGELPEGKTDYWQPVVTYKGGIKQWVPGQKYVREEPWERRETLIAYKPHAGRRNVKLTIHQRFIYDNHSGGELHLDSDVISELVEDESAPGQDKKSPVRLIVNNYNIIPQKDKKALDKEVDDDVKKALEMPPEMERALEHTTFLDLRLKLDDYGDVVEPQVSIQKGCPADIRDRVGRFGDSIIKALHSVGLKLPNRRIGHQEKWEGQRPLSVVTTQDVAEAKMSCKYQYLGQRVVHGRPQALIEMTGKLSRIKSKTNIGGAMEGRALVDLETGTVTQARARVEMELDFLASAGIPLRMRGTMDVRLDRQMPQ
jgi:S1-C subfamily serine protease